MSETVDHPDAYQQSLKRKPPPPTSLPPRRKLDKLARALGAVVLGWLAQAFFATDQLWPGLLLYAVAVPLFALQLEGAKHRVGGSHTKQLTDLGSSRSLNLSSGLRNRLAVGLIATAFAVSLTAMRLLLLEVHNTAALSLYLVSLLLFSTGVWLLEPRSGNRQRSHDKGNRGQGEGKENWHIRPKISLDYILIAILLLAAFFRLFRFFTLPFGTWYDEAEMGILARRVLEDPTFRPTTWGSLTEVPYLLYLFVFSFLLFGVSTPAMREVTVFFGIGSVLFAYLFGKEWKGRRWGLLLAFLVATLRWHVNFSRIAMTGVDTPFFEFATLYFAIRALRTGRLRYAAWTGLTIGLGLCFYEAFRLFLAAGVLFVLGWLALGGWRQISFQNSASRLVTRLALLFLAAWLAVMPIAQYALRHNDVFLERSRTVSIFHNRDEPNLGRALAQSTQKHLLMFNFEGDWNGRHNLPGEPMLDRLSAILFALGLGLAIVRRDLGSIFFLLLLPLGLAGGILTLDFEAPQSLRSIAVLPAVVYFIALSLDALWLELRWAARITRPRYSLALVIAGLGAITFSNAYTYFGPQAHDPRVWLEFSTAETIVGRLMAKLGPEPVYYASPFFHNTASVRFHAPPESPLDARKPLPLPDPLPAREPPNRPVVYFIHPDEEWVFSLAQQIYPTAQFEILPRESEYPPAVLVVHLEPDDLASVQGLETRYWPGDNLDGAPKHTIRSSTIDTTWPANAPLDLPFVAEWRGVLYAPEYGQYTIGIQAPDHVELTLDGETEEAVGDLGLTKALAIGNHDLRLRASGGLGQVRLWWQPPGGEAETVPSWALYSPPISAYGLLGKYYPNPDWQGTPTMERVDPVLNVYFHLTPLPRPYSVEWTGVLNVPETGVYQLGLRSVDQARLYLDSQPVVEATVPDEYTEAPIELEAGPHDLRITYQDLTGRSRIHLYWTRPNSEREIIPAPYLWPGRSSPQPPQPPVLPSPAEDLQAMDLNWQATWGEPGDAPGQFTEPRDVAVIGDTVFVADTGNRRVQAFDQDGTYKDAWTGAEEPFREPLALGVAGQNRLLVLDSPEGWVYRFESNGRPLTRIGGPAIQAYHPRGMTVLDDDTVLVADTGGGRLLFLAPTGDVQRQMGEVGQGLSQFSEPTDVAVDDRGVQYVVEAYNQRVQLVDSAGRGLIHWPIPHSIAHDGPHLARAPDGSLLITAPEEGAIQRYSSDGRLLDQWTQAGPTPLCRPVGIYLEEATNTLYVTDTACHHVHVFEIE